MIKKKLKPHLKKEKKIIKSDDNEIKKIQTSSKWNCLINFHFLLLLLPNGDETSEWYILTLDIYLHLWTEQLK